MVFLRGRPLSRTKPSSRPLQPSFPIILSKAKIMAWTLFDRPLRNNIAPRGGTRVASATRMVHQRAADYCFNHPQLLEIASWTGRLCLGSFLPYVTGGVAFLDYKGGGEPILGGPILPGADFSKTKVGWTLGAGVAAAFNDHLIGNIECRYTDYGSTDFATPNAFVGTTRVKLNENAIKVGVSYKF